MRYILYKLINFLSNQYWKEWQKQLKKRLAACGEDVRIGPYGNFAASRIHLGNHISISEKACMIATKSDIYIHDHVMIGPNVMIRGGNHRTDVIGRYMIDVGQNEKAPENDADVIIHEDVWIGANVTILSGVEIGEGSIIGAGAVVAKSIPPYTFHVGTHDIKQWPRFTEEELREHRKIIEKHKKAKGE